MELALEHVPSGAGNGGDALLRVRDNGRGIAKEVLDRLFEPSTHEERLNSGAHGGLGIGLIVVRGLVEMHGGIVEARSEGMGRGSVFTVHLPAMPPQALTLMLQPADDLSAERTSTGPGLRIPGVAG